MEDENQRKYQQNAGNDETVEDNDDTGNKQHQGVSQDQNHDDENDRINVKNEDPENKADNNGGVIKKKRGRKPKGFYDNPP